MVRVVHRSNKMLQKRPEGTWQLRVFHRKQFGKRAPRYLVKCGCCPQRVEIYYGDGTLEINGVMGSVEDWGELLFPLLGEGPARRVSGVKGLRWRRASGLRTAD